MNSLPWLIARSVLIVLAIPAVHIGLRATPLGSAFLYVMMVMPGLVFSWATVGLVGLICAIDAARRRAWKHALTWLIVPALIGTGIIKCNYVRAYSNIAGDVLHLVVMLPYYLAQIEKVPKGGEPRLLVFNRGGMIWASSGIVYDESDEIRLPPGKQSSDWKLRADKSELGCGGFYVTPLIGHFYLADFPC